MAIDLVLAFLYQDYDPENVDKLYMILCTIFFTCTVWMQTMLVPMAKNLLEWTEEEISIFYSAAGVEASQRLCL